MEQQQDPRVQEWAQEAENDERLALLEGTLGVLQRRVVTLNVEIRGRDARIETLQAEKAALEARLNDFLAGGPADPSEAPQAPVEGPSVPDTGDDKD